MDSVSNKCSNVLSENIKIVLNGVLHVLILFAFLTVLYFVVIEPLEKKSFEDEITDQVNDVIKDELESVKNKLDSDSLDELTNIINYNYTEENGEKVYIIDNIISKYDQESEDIKEHNKWIKRLSISIILVITIYLMFYIFTLSKTCNKNTEISYFIKENIITFAIVGIIEFLFFTQIAFKYIPAPPSLLVSTLLETFKKEIV